MQYMEDGFSQNLINRQKEIDSRSREKDRYGLTWIDGELLVSSWN